MGYRVKSRLKFYNKNHLVFVDIDTTVDEYSEAETIINRIKSVLNADIIRLVIEYEF